MFLLVWVFALIVLTLVIFAPTIIAFRRRHCHKWLVLLLNLLLGGTGIGWIAALIWAIVGEADG